MPDTLVAELKGHRRRQREDQMRRGIRPTVALVFPSRHGGVQKPSTLGARITAAAQQAGVKLSPHSLRRRHATDLLESGLNPKVASQRLGHANIGVTANVYQHILSPSQDAAADAAEALIRGS
jgi:integrase